MEIELATKNNYLIIRVAEIVRLDTDISVVKTIIEEKIEEGFTNFAISLLKDSRLSSMSIGTVLQCYAIVRESDGKVVLVNPNDDDDDLMEVLGFNSLIKICKSEDAI